jgi:hypothetical protein
VDDTNALTALGKRAVDITDAVASQSPPLKRALPSYKCHRARSQTLPAAQIHGTEVQIRESRQFGEDFVLVLETAGNA